MGYLGIQVLLSDYGRKLSEELCSPEAEAPAGAGGGQRSLDRVVP
jgi:hypothetical protein